MLEKDSWFELLNSTAMQITILIINNNNNSNINASIAKHKI